VDFDSDGKRTNIIGAHHKLLFTGAYQLVFSVEEFLFS
jgi:hypothetical protein